MNIHKHMEAIFVVAFGAVSAGKFALDSLPGADAGRPAAVVRDASAVQARAIIVRAPTLPQRA